MSNDNHTPGPWMIGSKVPRFVYGRNNGEPICTCDSMNESSAKQELANARLIAAAPDLLAALREIVRLADANLAAISNFAILDAKEAINKAAP